ncbi:MAG: NUDIX hydrolase [Candidatus Moraniibacteriota bacterium]
MIKENKIVEITRPVRLELLQDKFVLPPKIQMKVDAYWKELLQKNAHYSRGEVFTVSSIQEDADKIEIKLSHTDYAHFVYTRDVGLPTEYACVNVHTSCAIETIDDVLVLGVMGKNTAKAGILQFVGGGLDYADVRGHEIDLEHNIVKELQEEVGIDVSNKKQVSELQFRYLKYTNNEKYSSIAAIFHLKLKLSEREFRLHYKKFEKELKTVGKMPEFREMTYLPKNRAAIHELLSAKKINRVDHYMEALLGELAAQESPKNVDSERNTWPFGKIA